MAGFSKKQAYFVPQALLQLPHPIGWYKERLLPEMATRQQQAAHPTQGDKSQCAQKFLNELIPYFLEVALKLGFRMENILLGFSKPSIHSASQGKFKFSSECIVVCPIHLSHYQIYLVLEQNSRLQSLGCAC
jgi:hypothetical protein